MYINNDIFLKLLSGAAGAVRAAVRSRRLHTNPAQLNKTVAHDF